MDITLEGLKYDETRIIGCTIDEPSFVQITDYLGGDYRRERVYIDASAFSNNRLIQAIYLHSTDIVGGGFGIDAGAFRNCKNMTTFYLNVSTSEDCYSNPILGGCTALSSIIIGEEVSTVPSYMFNEAPIEFIDVPYNVKTLGEYCFLNCENLKDICIGTGLQKMERGCFARENRKLNPAISLYFNARALNRYDDYDNKVSVWPFQNCNLTEITFGNEVESLPYNAFRECNKLTDIYCTTTTPPALSDGCFATTDKKACFLHVPAGALGAYKSAPIWQDFMNIIVDEYTTGIRPITMPNPADSASDINSDMPVEIYNTLGRKVYSGLLEDASLEQGVYIVRQGSAVKKILKK